VFIGSCGAILYNDVGSFRLLNPQINALYLWVRSSVVEHSPFKRRVVGSNPTGPTDTMEHNTKVAFIVGGARMGTAVGRRLSQDGYAIVFGYRSSRKSAEASAAVIQEAGGRATVVACDVTKASSLREAVQHLAKAWGRLDVLINLASAYESAPAVPSDAGLSWDLHLDSNAKGSFLLTTLAVPLLRKAPRPRVIHISDWTSASGRPRYSNFSAYYVSKAAVKSVVEALALELAPGILVNAIAPGPMLPPPDMSLAERKAVEKATPLHRWGGGEEIAKTVAFLVETDFVTGETIRVDGGRHLS
jgi:NAD(P)-dependent dehydrogenase (short-subunit alcohol dehydrogenase family)